MTTDNNKENNVKEEEPYEYAIQRLEYYVSEGGREYLDYLRGYIEGLQRYIEKSHDK